MKLRNGQTLLFIGDSITDCGRARPVGERGGLGSGYVSLVNARLEAAHPEISVRVLNTGISGNRVTDLDARWETDVIALRPDWLSIMIGINDVWRQLDDPMSPVQVPPKKFEQVYRGLLERTRSKLKGLVLLSPFFTELNRKDPMRKLADQYGAIGRKLAGEFDAAYGDVQSAFDRHLKHRPTQSFCGDRVHPNLSGHMVIAETFLAAIR